MFCVACQHQASDRFVTFNAAETLEQQLAQSQNTFMTHTDPLTLTLDESFRCATNPLFYSSQAFLSSDLPFPTTALPDPSHALSNAVSAAPYADSMTGFAEQAINPALPESASVSAQPSAVSEPLTGISEWSTSTPSLKEPLATIPQSGNVAGACMASAAQHLPSPRKSADMESDDMPQTRDASLSKSVDPWNEGAISDLLRTDLYVTTFSAGPDQERSCN